MATFPATLVTPERILLEEDVAAVILRTDGGDAAFMPGHTPLIGALVPGAVRFQHEDGTEERAAVHGGLSRWPGTTSGSSRRWPNAPRRSTWDAPDGPWRPPTSTVSPSSAGRGQGNPATRRRLTVRWWTPRRRDSRAEVRLEVAGASSDTRAS